ncbi:hypothetical protein D3C75_1037120 [compost metagenome]
MVAGAGQHGGLAVLLRQKFQSSAAGGLWPDPVAAGDAVWRYALWLSIQLHYLVFFAAGAVFPLSRLCAARQFIA